MKKIAFAVLPLAFAITACGDSAEEATPVEPMATETPMAEPMATEPMATETTMADPAMDPAADPAMDPAADPAMDPAAAPADEAM